MPADDPLKTYREKRNFERTSEPRGETPRTAADQPRFVIQKHDASRLHYDFRIEVDGVLKSWAVPKGPSTNPRERRLAVQTEDHPIEYIDFEGIIPEGEYGAGTMIVWDTGTYRNLKEIPVAEGLEKGQIEIWLVGQKLQGGYVLLRTGQGEDANWLLIKMKDEAANPELDLLKTEPKSVLTGRTLDDIAGEDV